ESFEHAVATADDIADDLVEGADTVARVSALDQRLAAIATKRGALARRSDELIQACSTLDEEWRVMWQRVGTAPSEFDEAREWLRTFRTLTVDAKRCRDLQTDIEGHRRSAEHHANCLRFHLDTFSEESEAHLLAMPLEELVALADGVIAASDEQRA